MALAPPLPLPNNPNLVIYREAPPVPRVDVLDRQRGDVVVTLCRWDSLSGVPQVQIGRGLGVAQYDLVVSLEDLKEALALLAGRGV